MLLRRNLPIRVKLTAIILTVSSITLLAAAIAIVSFEIATSRDRLVEDVRGLAELMALSSRAALEFDDPEAAVENLQALSARTTVLSAAIYDRDGTLFATYLRGPDEHVPARAGPPGARFDGGYLEFFQPAMVQDGLLGTVYLRADLGPLYAVMQRYALIVAGMFAVLLLGTLALAVPLQRRISAPILELAGIARAITERQDFRLRATKHSDDEIGLLTDAFNQMLGQIQAQHADLRQAYAELALRHDEVQREISERRRAEAQVRTLNQELEQRVAARTAQLEAANQELEGFSYSVSHDLRAPLRGIDGFTRILEEEYGPRLDGEAHRIIGIVRENCRSMGQLIDDLLAFSRLGRAALNPTLVDMGLLVGEVIGELQRTPGEELPSISVDTLPPVRCDHALIRQVWYNLIGNAVKFSSRTEMPQLHIWGEVAGREVVYAISDNGVGFDMRYYDKLYGVFQRLHKADEFSGTGVGLATVKRIVVRHDGRVWAEGQVNEGATFYFALPGENPDE